MRESACRARRSRVGSESSDWANRPLLDVPVTGSPARPIRLFGLSSGSFSRSTTPTARPCRRPVRTTAGPGVASPAVAMQIIKFRIAQIASVAWQAPAIGDHRHNTAGGRDPRGEVLASGRVDGDAGRQAREPCTVTGPRGPRRGRPQTTRSRGTVSLGAAGPPAAHRDQSARVRTSESDVGSIVNPSIRPDQRHTHLRIRPFRIPSTERRAGPR